MLELELRVLQILNLKTLRSQKSVTLLFDRREFSGVGSDDRRCCATLKALLSETKQENSHGMLHVFSILSRRLSPRRWGSHESIRPEFKRVRTGGPFRISCNVLRDFANHKFTLRHRPCHKRSQNSRTSQPRLSRVAVESSCDGQVALQEHLESHSGNMLAVIHIPRRYQVRSYEITSCVVCGEALFSGL